MPPGELNRALVPVPSVLPEVPEPASVVTTHAGGGGDPTGVILRMVSLVESVT